MKSLCTKLLEDSWKEDFTKESRSLFFIFTSVQTERLTGQNKMQSRCCTSFYQCKNHGHPHSFFPNVVLGLSWVTSAHCLWLFFYKHFRRKKLQTEPLGQLHNFPILEAFLTAHCSPTSHTGTCPNFFSHEGTRLLCNFSKTSCRAPSSSFSLEGIESLG